MDLHPIDDAYRVYLRAELAKLRNAGDADGFLARGRCELDVFGLPSTTVGMAGAFRDQGAVDAFVDALDLDGRRRIARCCEHWRGNSLARKLAAARAAEFGTVALDRLSLAAAEPEPRYRELFERHDGWLVPIAADPELRALRPYSEDIQGAPVGEARCVAEPDGRGVGNYRIIDGIHRAIHLTWSGAQTIDLCVLIT